MLHQRTRRRALFAGAAASAAAAAGITASTRFAHAQDPVLRDAADALGKDIGVAVDVTKLGNDTAYRDTIAAEFNNVTAENVMKMDALQPSQGQYDFAQADTLVGFAAENGQTLHGHTLVWHSQSPGWIQSLSGADLEAAMADHIATVLEHFQGSAVTWDVINEVVSDTNGELRDSFWLQGLGEDFIRLAFEYARAADSGADLYMNDYSIEGIGPKSDTTYEIASGLAEQGLLDGVGFQSHLILGQVPSDMEANLQRFVDLGLKVRITELDIRMDDPSSDEKFAQQAEDYQRVVEIAAGLAECSGITVWGLRDGDSWVPGTFPGQGAPLLFNDDMSRKPAYDATLAALGGA